MKYIGIVLFAALLIVFAATPFFGDDQEFFSYYVTPDIWIILDTSGSMTWDMVGCHTFGDGSEGYYGRDMNGDGFSNDSRLFIVKNAISGLVADPEIDIRWGLATFFQKEYNDSSDKHYRIPKAGHSYPPPDECYPWWSFDTTEYYRPNMWWHADSADLPWDDASKAFYMRVQLSEGAPSHINNILSYMDHATGAAPKKEFHAQGGTPIAGALRGARYEYMSTIPMDNAKWCRGYYVILLSDGEPTYGIDPSDNVSWSVYDGTSPQWMKNQCYWEAESLMNTYVAAQGSDPDTIIPVKTYVIGIGNQGGGTLDTIAICGGTENYYPATNPDELQEVLRSIISDIMNEATSYSGSEVTSIQEQFINTSYEARLYLCSFVPSYAPIWEGHMKAVKLVEGILNIDSIPDSLLYWDAGEVMDTMAIGSRTIYTEKGYSLIPFNTGTISPLDLDVATNGERDTLVHIVYAGHIKSTTGYLGDIFHSTPLRIRGPNYFYEDDNFYIFRETMNTTRDPVLYAGSNTGMVHCISDSTGEELWAFIPNDQLPNLKSLRVAHRYFQDANVMAADIWFPSGNTIPDSFKDENEWKTVMFCGQRQGGHNYSVLDVTDPYNPDFLFNFDVSMADLGQTWSNPIMFKIHKDSLYKQNERFFAFLGGGYYNDTLYDIYSPDPLATPPGTGIYALDIVEMSWDPAPVLGTDYWKIPVANPGRDTMYWTFPSQASVIDTNLDTYADLLFIGDWAGQLWKVVINSLDSTELIIDDWEAEIIFKAPRPIKAAEEHFWQPIFFPSTAAWDGRRWWIFFGTGDRANASKEGTINRYYAIMDSTYSQPLTEADLKQTSDLGPLTELEIVGPPHYKGWYFIFTDFDNTDSIGKRLGEKVTSFATVLMDTLIFTTFQPYDQNDPCINANGVARLYKVHYKMGSYNGLAPSQIVGFGLPQAPRYSFTISGEGMQIINLPGEVIVQPAPSLGIRRRLLWWHEIQ